MNAIHSLTDPVHCPDVGITVTGNDAVVRVNEPVKRQETRASVDQTTHFNVAIADRGFHRFTIYFRRVCNEVPIRA